MNAKRLITLLLVAALAVGVCPAVFAEGDAPRGILLFAGYTGRADGEKYPAYSRDDIAKLTRNASDLVICAGGAIYNTYAFGNEPAPIVTQELIDALPPELVGSAADLESVRRDYRAVLTGVRLTDEEKKSSHIDTLLCNLDPARHGYIMPSEHITGLFARLDPVRYEEGGDPYAPKTYAESISGHTFSLDELAADTVALVGTIVEVKPDARVWLPFPNVYFPSLAGEYEAPFTLYVNALREVLGEVWETNIRGFYWGTESAAGYYAPTAADSERPLPKLAESMDALLSGYSKQFLWIPVMGDTEAEIVNGTDIFDFALFQPGYYFNPGMEYYKNLARVKKSVREASGTTAVGYLMEIDSGVTTKEYNDRYWEYTDQLAELRDGCPCLFYAGDRNSVCGTTWGQDRCFYYTDFWLGK